MSPPLLETVAFPRFDDKEGGAPGALHNDDLALLEGSFLEQAGDLLGLPPVHPGEELDALKGGNGVARRAGRRCPAARLPSGDGAALKEVSSAVGN